MESLAIKCVKSLRRVQSKWQEICVRRTNLTANQSGQMEEYFTNLDFPEIVGDFAFVWGRFFFLASPNLLGWKKHTLDRSKTLNIEKHIPSQTLNGFHVELWLMLKSSKLWTSYLLFNLREFGVKSLLAHVLGGQTKTLFFSQQELCFGWFWKRPTFSPPVILKFPVECFDNGVASKLVNFFWDFTQRRVCTQPPENERKWFKKDHFQKDMNHLNQPSIFQGAIAG